MSMDSLLIVTEKHEGGVATGLNVHHNVSRGEQFETIVYHFDGTTHWGSLVEGDEQLDRANSPTTMELCHAFVA